MATPKVTTPRGLVAVTGGSGYIAGYCIAQLLNEGWRARTTVRNLGAAEKVRATISKITANASAIEFMAADLNSDVGWADAVAGADYVLHVASPVPNQFVVRLRVHSRLYELGKPRQVSSEKARRILGWTTRPVPETVLDTARSLQARGLV